jgi:hypothetical protein
METKTIHQVQGKSFVLTVKKRYPLTMADLTRYSLNKIFIWTGFPEGSVNSEPLEWPLSQPGFHGGGEEPLERG